MKIQIMVEVLFLSYFVMVPTFYVESAAWRFPQGPMDLIPSVFILGTDADLSNWELVKRAEKQNIINEEMRKKAIVDFGTMKETMKDNDKDPDPEIFFRFF